MKKLKVLSVLVAAMFCLGIVSPAFANKGTLKGGTFNPNEYKETKKVSESYKAPKTKIKKSKNKIIISKGSYKKTISTKGLSNKQKTDLVKLAKQLDKKYENNAKTIAKKLNNKVLDYKITDKYGAKGLKQVNKIVETTGLSKKTVFKILKAKKIKTASQVQKVAKEVSTLISNADDRFFGDYKKHLKKAADNVKKGIKTEEIDHYYDKFGFN